MQMAAGSSSSKSLSSKSESESESESSSYAAQIMAAGKQGAAGKLFATRIQSQSKIKKNTSRIQSLKT